MHDPGHFEDLLNQLERDVLSLDRTGDTSLVHLLFRTVHNLKSSTAQAGFTSLSREIHELEDALDRIRRGKDPWSASRFDMVTRVIDQVRFTVLGVQPDSLNTPALEASLPIDTSNHWGLDLASDELAACEQAMAQGQGLFRIEKLFRKGLSREVFNTLPIMEDIQELGTLIAMQPTWEAYSEGAEEQVIKLLFVSPKSAAELSEILFDPLMILQEPSIPRSGATKEALRFLIVEDDPTAGGLLQYILKQHGECLLCESGSAGLTAFREGWDQGFPFDMVILDLFLPDMHGDDILKEIREYEFQRGVRDLTSRCKVIINTASKDLSQLRQSLVMEPDGYLIKPINVEVILEKVAGLRAERLPH